ncbi:MAG: hypothetical protein JXQ77_00970 [Campylobacterales bacterium]|nr:hypothetical protein [Campylobacterales bacterium]
MTQYEIRNKQKSGHLYAIQIYRCTYFFGIRIWCYYVSSDVTLNDAIQTVKRLKESDNKIKELNQELLKT